MKNLLAGWGLMGVFLIVPLVATFGCQGFQTSGLEIKNPSVSVGGRPTTPPTTSPQKSP
jgi:hypothetical protein